MSTHNFNVCTHGYDDDGIWLECACGWEYNFGYNCDPDDIIQERDRHCASIARRPARRVSTPNNAGYGQW